MNFPKYSLIIASLRHIRRHPWLVILSVLGIALGVAVVVAIDLANSSALQAFKQANQTLTGKATHRIVGGPAGIDEKDYVDLRIKLGVRQATPLIEGYGISKDYPGYTFQLLGVESFSEAPFRDFSSRRNTGDDGNDDLTRLFTEPFTTLMTKQRADELGLQQGDFIDIILGKRELRFTLIGYIPGLPGQSTQALDNVLLMDIATAQASLAMQGRLSRIELIVPDDANSSALLAQVQQLFPPGTQIISTQSANQTLAQMTRAFRTNLSAMSLLALLVGAFIIYNSMSFSVVQRREMFGVLRVLGVTGKEINQLIYIEALVIGVVGTVFGILLGIIMSYGLLSFVTQTVSDLYRVTEHADLSVSTSSIIKGIALGLGAALVAAYVPAREATTISPQRVMQKMQLESKTLLLLPRLLRWGVLVFLAGIVVLALAMKSLAISFAALFMLVIGYVLTVPQTVRYIIERLQPLLGRFFGLKGRMAIHSVKRNLSRTSVAMAALIIAVATTLGTTIMIESFRGSVIAWIDDSMQADVYVSMPRVDRYVATMSLDESLISSLSELEQVKYVSKGRRVSLQSHAGEIELIALELPQKSLAGFKLIEGEQLAAWQAFSQQDAVIISEPYAYRHHLSLGDTLILPTQLGDRSFDVVGVYSDYASERGRVVVSLDKYRHYWHDDGISTVGLYLNDGANVERLVDNLRQLLPAETPLTVSTREGIREATIAVFDRTFAITEVLRIVTIFVAFVGILSALIVLQLERGREFAMLRAIGFTPKELWKLVVSETALIGAFVGLISLPLGILLSMILVHVINRRSFGWSMDLMMDISQLMSALLLAVIAALLAGLYPAYRMARTQPALALRGE